MLFYPERCLTLLVVLISLSFTYWFRLFMACVSNLCKFFARSLERTLHYVLLDYRFLLSRGVSYQKRKLLFGVIKTQFFRRTNDTFNAIFNKALISFRLSCVCWYSSLAQKFRHVTV
jgi:hypothetical protein